MDYDAMLFDTPEERANTDKALLEKMRKIAQENFNAQLQEIEQIESELSNPPENEDEVADRANRRPMLFERLQEARTALADMDRTDIALGINEAKGETLDLNTEPPTRDWLIDQWLPANCVSMLTGQGGVGKSFLMLEVVSALCMGYGSLKKFLCKDIQMPNTERQTSDRINCVWATWEDDKDEITRRLRRIHNTLGWPHLDQISDAIRYVDLKMLGPLWGPELAEHVSVRGTLLQAGHQLMRICTEHEASLLVLDPCAGAFGGNENDRSAVRQFTGYLNGWAMQNQCAVMLLAHPPKSRDESYSGSTDWLGSVRSLWKLAKHDDNNGSYFSLTHEKSNYAMTQPERFLKHAPKSGVWIEVDTENEAIINKEGNSGRTSNLTGKV